MIKNIFLTKNFVFLRIFIMLCTSEGTVQQDNETEKLTLTTIINSPKELKI